MEESTRVRARDWIILAILVVVGIVFGKIQNSARSQARVDAISTAVQTLVDGPSSVLRHGADNVDEFWTGITHASSLTEENRRLKALLQSASLYDERVSALLAKNDRLRKMVELPSIGNRKRIAADVIAYYPHENRLRISVGKRNGVTPMMPVVNQDGLIGVVQSVEEGRCQVTLITSPTLTVGAVAQRDPPQPGLLRGQTPTRMLLEFVDTQSPLEVGDKVVTSGHSETIPGGIPIGRIIQIENDADFGSRRAQVFPNVKVGELKEVFVLK